MKEVKERVLMKGVREERVLVIDILTLIEDCEEGFFS